jgi:hypothetical protein
MWIILRWVRDNRWRVVAELYERRLLNRNDATFIERRYN